MDQCEKDYYNPMFNSYDGGEGSNLDHALQVPHMAKGCETPIRLHISNVPRCLIIQGVKNIFREVVTPTSVILNTSHSSDRGTNWGFVDVKSISMAQRAIEELSGKPPFNIKIQIAKSQNSDRTRGKKDEMENYVIEEDGLIESYTKEELEKMKSDAIKTRCENLAKANENISILIFDSKKISPKSAYPKSFINYENPKDFQHLNSINCEIINEFYTSHLPEFSFLRSSFLAYGLPITYYETENGPKLICSQELDEIKLTSTKTAVDWKPVESSIEPLFTGKCFTCFMPTIYSCSSCHTSYCSTSCYQPDCHSNECSNKRTLDLDILKAKTLIFNRNECRDYFMRSRSKAGSENFQTESDSQHYPNKPRSDFQLSPTGQTVKIMNNVSDNNYWAIKTCNIKDINYISEEIAKTIGPKKPIKPIQNEIFTAFYNKQWLRVKVIELEPLTLFLIDKGEEISIDLNIFHLPNELDMNNIPPYAFKIVIERPKSILSRLRGTFVSNDYLIGNDMMVKCIEMTKDGLLCKVVTDIDPQCETSLKSLHYLKNYNHVLSTKIDAAIIRINKIMDENVFTGSLLFQDYSDILAQTESSDSDPELGSLVATKVGSEWLRGYVVYKKDVIKVALIDNGVVVTANQFGEMSPDAKSLPETAIRCYMYCNISNRVLGNDFEILTMKMNEDAGKLIAEVKTLGIVEITPWEPTIEEVGLACVDLKNNSEVKLSAIHGPQNIYLTPAEKNDGVRNEIEIDLYSYVHNDDFVPDKLIRPPFWGELVCCKIHEKLYSRAQVYQKCDDAGNYKVNFIDYGNTGIFNYKEMIILSDSFKKIPCQAVKCKLEDVPGDVFTINSLSKLLPITKLKKKLILLRNDDYIRLTLNSSDLNAFLKKKQKPSYSKQNRLTPYAALQQGSKFYLYENLEHEIWYVLQKVTIRVVECLAYNSFIGINLRSVSYKALLLLQNEINQYCESSTSYCPRRNELCLVKYEGYWHRAVCKEVSFYTKGDFVLYFIDSGYHYATENLNDIRKMTFEFNKIPSLLQNCRIFGMPEKDGINEDQEKQLCNYIQELAKKTILVEAIVLGSRGDDDNGSLLFVPSFNDKLIEIGLPPVPKPVNDMTND